MQQIARERYQANKQEYASPATYTLRHLKVSEEKYGGVAAKLVAENARRRALEGEDFAAIITELGDADAPGEFNGDVPLTDLLRVDQIVRLSIAALKSRPGFTEVFEGGGGYNLIELVRSNPAVVPPFEDVRGQIEPPSSPRWQQARTTYMKRFVLMPTQMNDEVVQQLFSRYFKDLRLRSSPIRSRRRGRKPQYGSVRTSSSQRRLGSAGSRWIPDIAARFRDDGAVVLCVRDAPACAVVTPCHAAPPTRYPRR